jgi:hypothetical protein
MQILLQVENLILNATTKIDDDCVWEVANSIRWLNQTFKEKFKIEKFLFGEIYSNYYQMSPEFILNLMEELGYDKEDNNNNNNAADTSSEISDTTTTTTNNNTTIANGNKRNSLNNSKDDDSILSNSSINLNQSADSFADTNQQDEDILNNSKRKKS